MTAPKWAMERGRKLAALIGFHPSGGEFAFRIANNLAAAHREGWQAAIEAAAELVERVADPEDDSAEGNAAADAYNAGSIRRSATDRLREWSAEVAKAVRALQPPGDRGDL